MISLINYLQNEDLTAVAVRLGDLLARDANLREYCQRQFLKNLKVIIGADASLLPEEEDAPYVLINDLGKHEGAGLRVAQYEATFCVGVKASESLNCTTGAGAVVLDGYKKLTELMTLVQDALNRYREGNNPPDDVEGIVLGRVGNSPNHWLGALSCQWTLEIPLGRKEEF